MKKRIAAVLGILACCCAIGAPVASAGQEYFYYNNWLGAGGAVSGSPEATLYFVAAYTGTNNTYCVGPQAGNKFCATGTAITWSGPARWDRGELQNHGHTDTFTAEERW